MIRIADMVRGFARGETTPAAAVAACFEAVAARNAALNALIHVDADGAREAAAASSERYRANAARSPIDGVPIVVKANVAVAGMPFTAALGPFAERMATCEADAVARLRQAGAVILGIANMHEGALGATTVSPLYGPAYHPLRDGLTPGGSSGGSAAAVAAGFCAGAIGTDTMGSVRLPSSYCGVVGFKPSFGRIPRWGAELLSFSLDHLGVHAADVAGARALLDVMADDRRSENGAMLAPLAQEKVALASVRIGVVAHDVVVAPQVAARFGRVVTKIAAAGARKMDAPLGLSLGKLRREALLVAEAECAALFEGRIALDDARLSETFRQLVAFGARQSAMRLAAAHRALLAARERTARLFDNLDVLICPTTPHVAFPHAEPAPATQADLTVLANAAGLPAISLPMGDGGDGLPCGLQIIAPAGADGFALAVAEAIEAVL